MKKQIKANLKENIAIIVVLLLALILGITSMLQLGVDYTLNSDDLSYILSGINFKNNFEITMHGSLSAQIMPGMTWLIAFISMIFGEGYNLWLVLKILWLIMSLFSIYGLYRIILLYGNKVGAIVGAIFLLTADFIWMNNLILTETPFMLAFIFLIYNSLLLEKTKNRKHFYFIIFWYFIALMFKANIAPYPLFLIIFLLIKGYDRKLLFNQLGIAICIMSLYFVPWIARNYIQFDKFIPLTYGSGNPKLLGTYQGVGYPEDDNEAYEKYVEENASTEMLDCLNDNCVSDKLIRFYFLEKDGLIAEYRMKEWWGNDKISFLKSYLLFKPYHNINNAFYWHEIFSISKDDVMIFRHLDIILCGLSGIYLIIKKKYISVILFVGFNYIFQIGVYSYTFAFDRYGQTLIFLRLIVIGMGVSLLYDQFIKRKGLCDKHKSLK